MDNEDLKYKLIVCQLKLKELNYTVNLIDRDYELDFYFVRKRSLELEDEFFDLIELIRQKE